jgi:hypothetical protein
LPSVVDWRSFFLLSLVKFHPPLPLNHWCNCFQLFDEPRSRFRLSARPIIVRLNGVVGNNKCSPPQSIIMCTHTHCGLWAAAAAAADEPGGRESVENRNCNQAIIINPSIPPAFFHWIPLPSVTLNGHQIAIFVGDIDTLRHICIIF